MVVAISSSCLLSSRLMLTAEQGEQSQESVKYFDFGDESEKEAKLKETELGPQLKLASFLYSLGLADVLSEFTRYLRIMVFSRDFLEIPTPPPEN